MGVLVEQQDTVITNVEATMANVNKDTEKAYVQTDFMKDVSRTDHLLVLQIRKY